MGMWGAASMTVSVSHRPVATAPAPAVRMDDTARRARRWTPPSVSPAAARPSSRCSSMSPTAPVLPGRRCEYRFAGETGGGGRPAVLAGLRVRPGVGGDRGADDDDPAPAGDQRPAVRL